MDEYTMAVGMVSSLALH